MAFQSFTYFVFLFVMVISYYVLPTRLRWLLLLVGSYYFYMCWNASYALLMLLSTVVTYGAGLLIDRANRIEDEKKRTRRKKGFVALSLVLNLSILFFFKYYNMFATTINTLLYYSDLPDFAPKLNVLLPVGISFYIFQALGYTVDVYRGTTKATHHFGKYALFVSFFPQLVAGPIERSDRLLHQFDEIHRPNYETMRHGAFIILLGLVKKLVIADRLAMLVDLVYSNVEAYRASAYIVATICFAFQIYCDFSGYSDIAIGSAQLLGYRLMRNFDRPYFSRSINEFWRRWHVSLSSWFRDYLYIPLGGSRVSVPRWALNILIVFLFSGLWHGASWTFAAWGALNGLYIVVGRFTKPFRDKAFRTIGVNPDGKLRHAWAIACTFALTCFGWMLFRADSLSSFSLMFQRLFWRWNLLDLMTLIHQINGREFLLMALLILGLLILEMCFTKNDLSTRVLGLPLPARWAICLSLLFLLILFGKYNESPSFIYFQF